jgi:hypothetical protein
MSWNKNDIATYDRGWTTGYTIGFQDARAKDKKNTRFWCSMKPPIGNQTAYEHGYADGRDKKHKFTAEQGHWKSTLKIIDDFCKRLDD